MEGNLRFKIDWASLIVGSIKGNFPSTSLRGAYIWRGDLTEGFLCYQIGGLIHGGAYFRNFSVDSLLAQTIELVQATQITILILLSFN